MNDGMPYGSGLTMEQRLARVEQRGATLLPAATTSIGAAVPNPYDGQLVRVQDAAMLAAGIMWAFRYNAASGSAYKWEAVGAPVPIRNHQTTMASGIAPYAAPQSGTAASLTVPLAGEYDIPFEAHVGNTIATAGTHLSPHGAGVTAATATAILHWPPQASGTRMALSRTLGAAALTAGGTLALRCGVTAGTGTWDYQRLAIVPIRVS